MDKHFLLAICLSLVFSAVSAQRVIRIPGGIEVGFETTPKNKGKVATIYVGGSTFIKPTTPKLEAFGNPLRIEFTYDSSEISLTPHPERKEWVVLSAKRLVRNTDISFWFVADEDLVIRTAIPKDRRKAVQDEKGNFLSANINWYEIKFKAGERVKASDFRFPIRELPGSPSRN